MAINFDHTANGNVTIKTTSSNTITLILPSTNGTVGQAITTDGAGNLSFSTVGGSSGSGVGISAAVPANVVSATYFITFVSANTGSYANLNVSTTGITFNPNTSSLTVGNTVFATHFDNVSDIKLKENVETLHNTMITLNQLNPVSFTWKSDGTKSFGLIAQEVEKILPEIVHTKDDDTKTVSYVQIISLLISALKDQQAQIDDINRRLNA